MKRIIGVSLFVGFSFVFVNQSNAYIDPGTGSMIIQGLLAAVAAGAVAIGIFWHRLKGFFGRLFGRNKDE